MEEKQIKKRKKKGFTLIELIIVLAVIAIIAAIAIPNFTKVRADSKVKADTQSCETIKRIVLTKLADDKVKIGETYTIEFSEDGVKTVKKGSTDLTDADDIVKEFKDVKKPQEDGATSYTIEIDDNGNVFVTNGKTGMTTTP